MIFLFADDVALVARSAEGLRCVFRSFAGFCTREHLTISGSKTKVVIQDLHWEGGEFQVDDF